MTFFQFKIIIKVCEIMAEGVNFDKITLIYKDKEVNLAKIFEVHVKSLNDLFFESFAIVLNKKKNLWMNKLTDVAFTRIRIRQFKEECDEIIDFDLYQSSEFPIPDHYNMIKSPIGKISLNIKVVRCAEQLEAHHTRSSITEFLNGIISSDITTSLKEIKSIFDIVFQGGPSSMFKNMMGFFLTETTFTKNRECSESDHGRGFGCFNEKCRYGYQDIPLQLAKESLQAAKYALASYLDSIIINFLVKSENKKFSHIKDSKIRAVLERAEDILEENIYKYIEGDSNTVGFVLFTSGDTLVIGFRGTLNHNDLLSDINCGYEPFLNGFAHSGLCKVAKKFIETEQTLILKLMKEKNIKKMLITGHSLGAAISSLLYIMLQDTAKANDFELKAYAFSGPPIVSKEIIDSFDLSGLIAFNYGNDMVPRLSIGSALDLKYICISLASDPSINLSIFNNAEDIKKITERSNEIQEYLLKTDLFPKLYQPGQVYHVKRCRIDNLKEYKMKLVNPLFFADLTQFKSIVSDHLISSQISAFEYTIKKDILD